MASPKVKANDLGTPKKECTWMHRLNMFYVLERKKIVSTRSSSVPLPAWFGPPKG